MLSAVGGRKSVCIARDSTGLSLNMAGENPVNSSNLVDGKVKDDHNNLPFWPFLCSLV